MESSEQFLGSRIKWDTSDPDSPKAGNEFFNYFKTTLKTLCKPLPILFADISAPLHPICAFLIWSHILNMKSLALIFSKYTSMDGGNKGHGAC